jgi:hypothetical protein
MSRFTSDLNVKMLGDKAQLLQSLEFFFDEKDRISYITVPKGFKTDFASTPRILYPFFPPIGRYTNASVVHDFLYSKESDYLNIKRSVADKCFLQAMKVAGVSRKRYLMYLGVRIGGFTKWKKK